MSSSIDWTEWQTLLALRDTPQIFERLTEMSGTELQVQGKLRREFPEHLVRAAMTLSDLRQKAVQKFQSGNHLWLDRVGLEQCTSEVVARHKAQRFNGLVWDYCSGIGSDAAALAAAGCEVITLDANPASCLRAAWNCEILAPGNSVQAVCGRVEAQADRSGLLHVDPDRRAGSGSRAIRVEDYVPGIDLMQQWMQEFQGGAIKLSPAANFGGKFPAAEIELISLHGECKEATVWFGSLAGEKAWRATALPSGETLAGDPMEAVADIGPLEAFLYDPDPAIVRAGLLDLLAVQLGLRRLDAAEEYLTGSTLIHSPFVRAFAVEAELSNNLKDVKAYYRSATFGQLEIKCRHLSMDVDRIRKQLTLNGSDPGVLFFARLQGKARAVVARRVATGP